mgnify:CR=1 FL=1
MEDHQLEQQPLPATLSARSDSPWFRAQVTGPAKLKGIDVDMHHISDTVMTLAALAPLAEGPTTIRNVANIRIKETDRLVRPRPPAKPRSRFSLECDPYSLD